MTTQSTRAALVAALHAAWQDVAARYDLLDGILDRPAFVEWRDSTTTAHAIAGRLFRELLDLDLDSARDPRREESELCRFSAPRARVEWSPALDLDGNRDDLDTRRLAARYWHGPVGRRDALDAALDLDRPPVVHGSRSIVAIATDPHRTPRPVAMPRVPWTAPRLSADRAERRATRIALPYVPASEYDPARPPAWSRSLDRSASLIIRAASAAAGCPGCAATMHHDRKKVAHDLDVCSFVPSPDTANRWTRRVHVRPDRVAFRGVVRHRHKRPVRNLPAYRTDRATGERVELFGRDPITGAALLVVHNLDRSDADTVRGWRGHVAFARPRRMARATTQAATRKRRADAGATGARGPARSAWQLSDGRVRARFGKAAPSTLVARAAWVESAIRRAGAGALDLGTAVVTILDPETVEYRDRVYGTRDLARRLALDEQAHATA